MLLCATPLVCSSEKKAYIISCSLSLLVINFGFACKCGAILSLSPSRWICHPVQKLYSRWFVCVLEVVCSFLYDMVGAQWDYLENINIDTSSTNFITKILLIKAIFFPHSKF
uniref:Uncharacterized protein n=1 Tax=Arundo donax TaxID=35708 RepID=A0A0A9FJ49_ARUDO